MKIGKSEGEDRIQRSNKCLNGVLEKHIQKIELEELFESQWLNIFFRMNETNEPKRDFRRAQLKNVKIVAKHAEQQKDKMKILK